ncbi:ribosome biogenesis protein bms1-like isoform X3 [Papaver somniferum]|uniref:ribosome biogenesis protein bms1-like isoform X3 n=1 Tax=Papaver somniferum TaxID=3469 RepID=UPI000E704A60|nr:ribosome biogenesis protein bms1-like isoform X3 [Papaver somniferum]
MEKINKKRKRQANNQKNISNYKKIEPITPPAPYVIVVHGPPKVGKSLLIKSLVKHYTNHNLTDDTTPGPITIVVGSGEEQRRIQFVECPNNVNGMIDASKYADAIILLIDVSYGFEMETLEFVNLLKVHGMPKLIGVFTNLDCFLNKDVKIEEMRTARFKKLFRNEIHEEAQIFCLSASDEDEKMYLEIDISKLASFILGMEFHPMSWRAANPYVLVDCFEDVTPTERLHLDKNCGRKKKPRCILPASVTSL